MVKSYLRECGLDTDWTREKVIDYVNRMGAVPQWSKEYGLIFTPKIFGPKTRKEVQLILKVKGKEDVRQLKRELYGN